MGIANDTPSEWVRSARAGSDEAIDRLCATYRSPLKRYVESQMGAQARRWTDPEDIVQLSLIEVIRGLDTLPEEAAGRAFEVRLRRVARRRIVDALRAHGRDQGESVVLSPEHLEAPRADGAVTRADTHRWLATLVERLPEKYRDVVRLCVFEGCSYAETAERLGLKPEAVRKRYERARDALSQKLTSRNDRHESPG